MFKQNLPAGFSLIEILIVVAIVGILVAIAYPSYEQKMQRVHAAAAKQYLLELSSLQSEFISMNYHYASTLNELGSIPRSEVSDYYKISISQLNDQSRPTAYTLQATAKSNSGQISQQALTLNHLGVTNEGWHD